MLNLAVEFNYLQLPKFSEDAEEHTQDTDLAK
jgi:hypothetical protein